MTLGGGQSDIFAHGFNCVCCVLPGMLVAGLSRDRDCVLVGCDDTKTPAEIVCESFFCLELLLK